MFDSLGIKAGPSGLLENLKKTIFHKILYLTTILLRKLSKTVTLRTYSGKDILTLSNLAVFSEILIL